MIKKPILLLLFVIIFTSLLAAQTVYITKTGTKYHLGDCSYLRKSKIAIQLQDAVTQGYTACSRCKPPTLKAKSNVTVNRNNIVNKNVIETTNEASVDSKGKTIFTGPKGGKYYINSHGKKTYVRRKK